MRFMTALLLALAASHTAAASEARPTAESVKQLLEVMHGSSIVDSYLKQADTAMRTSVQQATAGQTPNARQQQLMGELEGKIMSLVKEQLKWSDLEPIVTELYRDTFTQPEIDGMLKFYRSPAGQAALAKMPTVIQESMARMQSRVSGLTPQVVQLERDAAAQIRAAGTPQQAPAPQPQPPH